MSNELIEDLKDFLNDAELTSYETNAFIALIKSSKRSDPTAREISNKSDVPIGRVYEVLEDLERKGMIEIFDARPKKFRALPINDALENLISYKTNENRRKTDFLHDRARILEKELYNTNLGIQKSSVRSFWSTTFGTQSIYSTYMNYIKKTEGEILFNDFVDEKTLKLLTQGKRVYQPIREALERGVKMKHLWNFQIDKRFLTEEIQKESKEIFDQIVKLHEEVFNIFPDGKTFAIRYIHQKIPTLYDIFDKKRIVFKLQNPLKPRQIFATMNVMDPELASKLRENFLRVWSLESLE